MITTSNFQKNFGKQLQKKMVATGISQRELARRMNISNATISRWLNGSQASILTDSLFDLCDIFETDPLYFCGYERG